MYEEDYGDFGEGEGVGGGSAGLAAARRDILGDTNAFLARARSWVVWMGRPAHKEGTSLFHKMRANGLKSHAASALLGCGIRFQ